MTTNPTREEGTMMSGPLRFSTTVERDIYVKQMMDTHAAGYKAVSVLSAAHINFIQDRMTEARTDYKRTYFFPDEGISDDGRFDMCPVEPGSDLLDMSYVTLSTQSGVSAAWIFPMSLHAWKSIDFICAIARTFAGPDWGQP